MRLRSKATTQPDNDEASRVQHDQGQLQGKIAEVVMKAVLGDEHNLGCGALGEREPALGLWQNRGRTAQTGLSS
jgi:hypothetical protein